MYLPARYDDTLFSFAGIDYISRVHSKVLTTTCLTVTVSEQLYETIFLREYSVRRFVLVYITVRLCWDAVSQTCVVCQLERNMVCAVDSYPL